MRANKRQTRFRRFLALVFVWSIAGSAGRAAGQERPAERPGDVKDEIRVVFRADDMGAAHAINQACVKCFTDGPVRSVEVIVPGPWFAEAVELLNQTPGIDVGIHLDLTSEWSHVKWGPIAQGTTSLVDSRGYFFPMTSQRPDWPDHTGFLQSEWKINEVERELRAQIETGRKLLPNVTHLSAHMGTAVSTPELRALVGHLAEEYKLPLGLPGAGRPRSFGGARRSAAEKEQRLVEVLEQLQPGLWVIVEHPAYDTPEMRALGHRGYENVAEDRAGVTHALTSEKVKQVIRSRGIRVVSYGDVLN